jgi:S1-C subfamily serine protease
MNRLILLLAALAVALMAEAAEYSFLGVIPDKSTTINAQGFSGTGLQIRGVVAKSPAAQVGLRGGDILTHFNGKPVEDGDDLTFFLRKVRPGDKVSLDWVRGDNRMKGAAKLSARREPEAPAPPREDLGRALSRTAFLGVGSLAINDNLLEHFGVKEGHGILIDAIVKGSPAEKAGLRVGDVLVDLDGRAVDSPGRLRRLMESVRPGTKVRLNLVRNRQPLAVDVVVTDRDSSLLEGLEPPTPGEPALPEVPGLPGLPDLGLLRGFPGSVAAGAVHWVVRLLEQPLALLEN